jgi:hypothetical protein
MHKWIIALAIIVLIANISQACGPNEPAGESSFSHEYLYEKDPATWDIIMNGSWGKMEYRLSGDNLEFVFYGHKLNAGMNYTLIYYPDPWPGEGLICLGNSTSNENGDIHIAESVDTGDLPSENDENEGAKIWLVLSSDVDCENSIMVDWHPTEYLFEHNLIYFPKTTVEPPIEKCEKETNKDDIELEEAKDKKNSSEKPLTSLSETKGLKFLDKLLERFPIIEQILQRILLWIYVQLTSMEL